MVSVSLIKPDFNCALNEADRIFRNIPATDRLGRFWIAAKLDLAFATFKTNTIGDVLRKVLQTYLTTYMRRLWPSKYHDILIPKFDFGAKRPAMDHGYLNALHDPRVTLIRSSSLTVSGSRHVLCEDGRLLQADAIILANGFRTQELLSPMRITGEDDQELHQLWHQNGNFPSAYMGYAKLFDIKH